MWIGDTVYFRSDRNGEFNLFSYDTKSKAIRQLTRHDDFPVLSASAGGGRIVYEQAGYLHVFDPGGATSARADDRRPGGPARDAAAIRQGRALHPERRALAVRRARGVRVPRRDRHRAGRERGHAQSDGHHGRARAEPGVVAGRQADRVLLRRLRRVRAARRQPGRQRRAARRSRSRGPASTAGADLVSRQPEDLVHRQLAELLLGRPEERRLEEGRRAADLLAARRSAPRLVAGLEVDRVHREHAAAQPRGSRVFDRAGQVVPDHRRPQRGERAGVRPQRQVSVLLRLDRRGPGARLVRAVERRHAGDANDLSRRAARTICRRRSRRRATRRRPRRPRRTRRASRDRRRERRPPATSPTCRSRPRRPTLRRRSRSRSGSTSTTSSTASSICPCRPADLANLQAGTAGLVYYLQDGGREDRRSSATTSTRGRTRPSWPKPPTTSSRPTARRCCTAPGPTGRSSRRRRRSSRAKGGSPRTRIEVKIDPRAEWTQIFDEAWRINRDYFYAPNMHGVDWKAARDKYAAAAPARRDARRSEPRPAVDVERAVGRPSQRRRRRQPRRSRRPCPAGCSAPTTSSRTAATGSRKCTAG